MYEDILAAAIVQKALNGDAGAQTLLGQALDQHGQYQDAVKWLRSAADQGYDAAQLCLGNEYFWGHGVAQDYTLAQYWWRKAAEQGLAEGQALLGRLITKAMAWQRISRRQFPGWRKPQPRGTIVPSAFWPL